MKKILFSAALLMGLSTTVFAGNPKGANKDASASSKAENTATVVKWFHFTGDASSSTDLQDPSLYQEETNPQCGTTPNTYRCDILIQADENDATLPDLSQPIQAERKRANASE